MQTQEGTLAEFKVESSACGCTLTRLVVFQGTQRPQDPVKAGANRGADRGSSAEPGLMSGVRAPSKLLGCLLLPCNKELYGEVQRSAAPNQS